MKNEPTKRTEETQSVQSESKVDRIPTKPSSLFWFGMGVTVTVLVGGIIYFIASKEKIPTSVSPSPVAIATPAATVSTAGWQTYTNDLHGYEIKMPAEWKQVEHSSNFPDTERFQTVGGDIFEINVAENTSGSLENYLSTKDRETATGYEGQPSKKIMSVNTVKVGEYSGIKRREEWIAAGFVTDVTYVGINQKVFTFSNVPGGSGRFEWTEVYENYDTILTTFNLVNQNKTQPSPKHVSVKPPLMDTINWQTVTLKNIRFKVPQNYTFNISTENEVFVYAPEWVIPQITAQVRTYDGGSRRTWWIKEINASAEEVKKYMRFQEVQLGQVAALSVFADNGWWQGGYASPILIARATTIVVIHGGQNLSLEGELQRSQISDTVASTVEFL